VSESNGELAVGISGRAHDNGAETGAGVILRRGRDGRRVGDAVGLEADVSSGYVTSECYVCGDRGACERATRGVGTRESDITLCGLAVDVKQGVDVEDALAQVGSGVGLESLLGLGGGVVADQLNLSVLVVIIDRDVEYKVLKEGSALRFSLRATLSDADEARPSLRVYIAGVGGDEGLDTLGVPVCTV
jgi:hypothetical protein